jgi:hypothetical protein
MRPPNACLALICASGLTLTMFAALSPPARANDPTDRSPKKADPSGADRESEVPAINLLEALRDGKVSAEAEGIGDGRMTLSITNRTKRQLRVVLPPGIIAQSATGQFGGMGGMGGGMMGGMGGGGGMMGGMGGGMGGGMMGGMGGGMGGGGGQGGMGGMGSMGMSSGTMPATMGLMMLSRMIMYFCGDRESWDMRAMMIGMMGGGMGGMGGGMGGMGGGMGGMGGGMRSVPPTDLPSALLKPGQSRHLPTRLVSVSAPDPDQGLVMPEKGERLRIAGDIAQLSDNPQVCKALKRLTAEKAPAAVAQLVMWRLVAGLDWKSIAGLSKKWSNDYELTLARDFVDRLDSLAENVDETGRVRIELHGNDVTNSSIAAEATEVLKGKTMLGLTTEIGVPERPDGPSVGCRVRLSSSEAQVQVFSSDSAARNWVGVGKFSVPVTHKDGRFDVARFADDLTEGILSRLVRAQLSKGPRAKGKLTYQIRIDNASPLILNGLAAAGTDSGDDKVPRILSGICISPRRSLTVPASEEAVKTLGLKKGIRLLALDLSGL